MPLKTIKNLTPTNSKMTTDSSSDPKYIVMRDRHEEAKRIFNKHLNDFGVNNTSHFGVKAIMAIEEFAKSERNKVLDEAIEKIKVKGLGEDDYNGKIIFEILNSLKV